MGKVLVTGGAGFIGSHVTDGYVREGWEVVVVDNLSGGRREQVNSEAKFYNISITDKRMEKIFQKEKFDLVNHHGAQINVRASVDDPPFDARENVMGSLNLMEACKNYGVKNFIFISSGGAIYGEPSQLPVGENHPKTPFSPYGINKLTVEFYLYFYKKVFNLNYLSLRYANVYGPRQDPFGEAGVVAIFASNMLKGTTPTIFGDGQQTRDYVYVEDVVDANMAATEKIEKLNDKKISSIDDLAYNIGTGKEESVNSLYDKLSAITGFDHPPLYSEPREGEVRRIYLAPSRAKQELDWQAKTSLKEGLKKTVNWISR